MTANTAHLTGMVPSQRPSIFEILSHEGFSKALKPAVFHIAKVLANYKPNRPFLFSYQHFDEIYLAFDALIQWYYVLTRGATFSEAFYGLERKLIATDQKLWRIRLSYFMSVILPYLSSKLERLHKDLQEEQDIAVATTSTRATEGSNVHLNQFLVYYPYFKTVIRTINMFYLLAYTFDRSEHPSLIFKVLGMTLGYTSEERSKLVDHINAELWISTNWRDPKKLPKLILRSLGESVFLLVELGTFFMQFLDWWYNDEKRTRITTISTQIPPAPHHIRDENRKAQNIIKISPLDMNKCPLCRKEFKNPTAISVSGIAYCYSCIFSSLKREGKCPLTRLSCNSSHLIRIFS